jgi:hypothetical protein
MKAMLSRVGFNELLGFVRPNHSVTPDLSTFDSIIQHTHRCMAIRFTFVTNFRSLREAHIIQAASAFNINLSPDEDSRLLICVLSHSIQQKPNAGDNPPRARSTQSAISTQG